ncbi:MAG TPA: hypothetical protein DEF41_10140 [Desulfovibrio sp.]|uniref:Uncharacterized protein n=1 Tax=Nitratidesulfovibrio vulgaris (strain ATCC 29579 / DSM 644 / CCUG 34227 / NCIMB 8303 / VKM B-1760 / Hildenborough) TaxID=882 RepID=Q72DB4_NITV2|nr:hypothetical protein DVU_1015 [Nitratidesulfovibrio vulgaris str. Hildenborough]HBW16465.1 hypothetical protein [Desulfovibrio sp.]
MIILCSIALCHFCWLLASQPLNVLDAFGGITCRLLRLFVCRFSLHVTS